MEETRLTAWATQAIVALGERCEDLKEDSILLRAQLAAAKEGGQKDYDGMREFQRKFIAADSELRSLKESPDPPPAADLYKPPPCEQCGKPLSTNAIGQCINCGFKPLTGGSAYATAMREDFGIDVGASAEGENPMMSSGDMSCRGCYEKQADIEALTTRMEELEEIDRLAIRNHNAKIITISDLRQKLGDEQSCRAGVNSRCEWLEKDRRDYVTTTLGVQMKDNADLHKKLEEREQHCVEAVEKLSIATRERDEARNQSAGWARKNADTKRERDEALAQSAHRLRHLQMSSDSHLRCHEEVEASARQLSTAEADTAKLKLELAAIVDDGNLNAPERVYAIRDYLKALPSTDAKTATVHPDTARLPKDSPTWPLVLNFALIMEKKLSENRHKGDRAAWLKMDAEKLRLRIADESSELDAAIISRGQTEIFNEAADVANFAMMTADSATEGVFLDLYEGVEAAGEFDKGRLSASVGGGEGDVALLKAHAQAKACSDDAPDHIPDDGKKVEKHEGVLSALRIGHWETESLQKIANPKTSTYTFADRAIAQAELDRRMGADSPQAKSAWSVAERIEAVMKTDPRAYLGYAPILGFFFYESAGSTRHPTVLAALKEFEAIQRAEGGGG